MKRFQVFVLISSVLFFSCKTNTVFVPGEKNELVKKVFSEYYTLAEEYVKLENYTKAIENYKFAMKDKSLHDASYYKIGQCYAWNKQYKEAAEVFSNILKKDKNNVSLKSTVAYLTAMQGDVKGACTQYKNLVLENPDNPDLLVNYVSVLIVAKDYETAKINLEFLEKKFPSTTQLKSLKENLDKLSDSVAKESNN